MKRQSYQQGSVTAVRRSGVDRWAFRWYETTLDGRRVQRSVTFSDIHECPTKAAAQRLADRTVRHEIHISAKCIYFGQLADRYEAEDMPTRKSTAGAYRSNLARIRLRWGKVRLDHMAQRPMEIQAWIQSATTAAEPKRPLSSKSKKNLKALLHRMFECAMVWGYLEIGRNPIELVRLKQAPAQMAFSFRKPRVLAIEQYEALIEDPLLSRHVKVMVQLAMATGIRASEFLALKWADVDFQTGWIHIRRSVVGRHLDMPKTQASAASIPMHADLALTLLEWREDVPIIEDWLFGSLLTGRPFHRDALLKDHLQPAGRRVGIANLGWHSFRHTYRAMLKDLELPLEVQKELMRHAHIETTLKYGAGSERGQNKMREANARLVEMLPGRRRA